MGRVSEIRQNLDNYIRNLPSIMEGIVNFNEDLEQLNKEQLLSSKLATDKDIVNRDTGRAEYSPLYADWKSRFFPESFRDGKINLLLTGNLFDHLEIKLKGSKITLLSLVSYAVNLVRKYSNDIFGIAPSKQPRAKAITTRLLADRLRRDVF